MNTDVLPRHRDTRAVITGGTQGLGLAVAPLGLQSGYHRAAWTLPEGPGLRT